MQPAGAQTHLPPFLAIHAHPHPYGTHIRTPPRSQLVHALYERDAQIYKLPWFHDLNPTRIRDAARAMYAVLFGYHGPGGCGAGGHVWWREGRKAGGGKHGPGGCGGLRGGGMEAAAGSGSARPRVPSPRSVNLDRSVLCGRGCVGRHSGASSWPVLLGCRKRGRLTARVAPCTAAAALAAAGFTSPRQLPVLTFPARLLLLRPLVLPQTSCQASRRSGAWVHVRVSIRLHQCPTGKPADTWFAPQPLRAGTAQTLNTRLASRPT